MQRGLKQLLTPIALLFLIACDSLDDTPDADTIYINGAILTLSEHKDKVSAIAFKNGKVQAIGSHFGVMRHRGDATQVIDLDGKAMVPGFFAGNSQFSKVLAQTGDLAQAEAAFASQGITTLVDMGISSDELDILLSNAKAGKFSLEIIAIPHSDALDVLVEKNQINFSRNYDNRLKIAGFSLTLDGTSDDYSAWMAYPYQDNPDLPEPGWRGKSTMPFSKFQTVFQAVVENELQFFIHAMGDAAVDAIIQAGYDLKLNATQDQRHVVVMSRFMRSSQLNQYEKLGLLGCFDTSNLHLQGEKNVDKLGLSRANGQSPIHEAIELDLPASNICFAGPGVPDTTFILWSAVNRVSQEGEIMGPGLRLSPKQAIEAMTSFAAYQFFEEADKGELLPGKQADAVILSANPMAIAPGLIREIEIIETIKQGKSIYRQPDNATAQQTAP